MRILYLPACAPIPTTGGGSQRTNLLYQALRSFAEVDTLIYGMRGPTEERRRRLETEFGMISYHPPPEPERDWPWFLLLPHAEHRAYRLSQRFGSNRKRYDPDPEISRWLEEAVRRGGYDALVVRRLGTACRAGAFRFPPVVLDVDDLDTEVLRTRVRAPDLSVVDRLVNFRNLHYARRVVPRRLGRCRHLWLCSRADLERVQHPRKSLLPNIPFDSYVRGGAYRPSPESRGATLMIVGHWSFGPNADSFERFLKAIWPRIRAARPAARLLVVGSQMTDDQKARWGAVEGTIVEGYVESLDDAYERSAFTIAPVYWGGGTKIKVVESLWHARTCVVTSHAFEGYANTLPHEEALLHASSDAEFATLCIRLLDDPELRHRLARRGRSLVEQHFSFDRFRHIVRETLERAVGDR